jgi:hypothetical protein
MLRVSMPAIAPINLGVLTMRRFNASKVKALGNLQPTSDKQKRYLKRVHGIKQMFAEDKPLPAFKASRDYLCPMKSDFVPRKPRGRSHVRMGKEARDAMVRRHEAREAFFAGV